MKNSRNLIEELGNLVPVKNKHTVIEARAMHVISSATNLIESIKHSYGPELSEDLVKRLIKSIVSQDPQKFSRKIKQISKQEKS